MEDNIQSENQDQEPTKNPEEKVEHKHPEGFCLMNYKCEKCGKTEILWNSRNGVTPFMIGCIDCNGYMQHINWNFDKYDPDYFPFKGQRVFIDMTKEIHDLLHRRMIQTKWDTGTYPMKDHYQSKKEALKALTSEFYPDKGEPYVLTV